MEEIRLCTKRERGQSSNKHTASRAAHEIQNGAKICKYSKGEGNCCQFIFSPIRI